jgi:hypothetical protein
VYNELVYENSKSIPRCLTTNDGSLSKYTQMYIKLSFLEKTVLAEIKKNIRKRFGVDVPVPQATKGTETEFVRNKCCAIHTKVLFLYKSIHKELFHHSHSRGNVVQKSGEEPCNP